MACTINAAEIKRVKGMGFLNNKGTDLFNARIITVNGKITAEQTAVIAEAAKKFGNGDVEFTTRLTVEVRGIPFEKIEEFQAFIAPAGLITGGTGARVRPIVSYKGKRAYLVQNRLKAFGYTNTRVLEGGNLFTDVTVD